MTGCCLYCAHAASYWIDSQGKKRVPPVPSFGDMNIYCLHESRGPGECYPISFTRCSVFKRAGDDQIQRRREFFSQFDRWRAHAQIIAQRNSNVLETASKNSTKQYKSNQEG
nr:MAG TPA: hypothetical protein [Caudoviricetes sp.]